MNKESSRVTTTKVMEHIKSNKENNIPPGPASQALFARMKECIGTPNYAGLYGIGIKSGLGSYIVDLDDNVYLDCLAGASANILGYNVGSISETYCQQAGTMHHSCFPYSFNNAAIELAEKLCTLTPGDFPKRVMLGLSGSDGNGGAIQAMRKFTGRLSIIHFKNAWHGSTGLSQSASCFGDKNVGILPKSKRFLELPYPTSQPAANKALDQVELWLKSGEVGGLIAEPIQGDSGIHLPASGFFFEVAQLLKRYNALLIIDEVQSGMGRTGTWWAIEQENVIPDLLVSAKGLSAGYAPISAVIGRADVINSLDSAQQVFTYSGHPPSSAAAHAVLNYIEANNLVQHNKETGQLLLAGLQTIKAKYPEVVLDVRGRGLMIGAEINRRLNRIAGKIFATRSMEKGVYFGYFGLNAEVIRIEPPFVIKTKEVEKILAVFEEVASEMQSNLIPEHTYENVHKYSQGIGIG
ncbi:aminotransferase class III-fold pyridoxal phosphate-dependent enzyme [Desulfobulbus sp. TB]|nr:aminotransferase class III-fold pyridoxal phosphate-dependent enzyme [Desulfobulbus sp. TB]